MPTPSRWLTAKSFGVHNKAENPPTQPAAIANPTGGITVDAEARAAINAILTALRDYGLIAP